MNFKTVWNLTGIMETWYEFPILKLVSSCNKSLTGDHMWKSDNSKYSRLKISFKRF